MARLVWRAAINPLVLLLTVLACISFATGDAHAGFVMSLMIVLGVGLKLFQEAKADSAAAKLRAMISVKAMILLEKSLMVLEAGVVEGRKVFANLLKYVRMGASSNFGNMFSVLGASVFVPFLPMAPIQILANNLLYDSYLGFTALPPLYWPLLVLTLLSYVVLTQLVKT